MPRAALSLIRLSPVTAKMQSPTADMCAMQTVGRLLHLSGSGRPQTYQSGSPIVKATDLFAQHNKACSSRK